ncbi:Nitrogen assimilation transcription factor nirA [Vanrija pseudolonga]|uniref:Nitrogen assimilation transcription factor nirA n=1 Tax=Vanrija pseudolonga TaxID=143232 RepID=A0AAF0YEN4_9TREE|nr:Nitrogen assimilation transcription factor nirA [Vanrija pseudolonga]
MSSGPVSIANRAGNVDDLMVQDAHGGFRVHSLASAFRHEAVAEPMQSSTADRTAGRPRAPSATGFERFLPDVFLTQEQHDAALDRFFRYFASFCQRATPHLFYRDMRVALALDKTADLAAAAPNYSPMLHNMILALGLSYADEPHLRALSTRRQFLEESMRYIDQECVVPCVGTVQALAFRAGYSSTMGDFSLGWINFGQAIRLCYSLGLNIDTSPLVDQGKMSHEMLTQRNVTFWTCFCQEVTFANYLGRTPAIIDYSVPLPVPDSSTDQHPWTWPAGPHAHRPSQPSYLSTTMVATSSLMQIAAQITKALYTEREDVAALVNNGTIKEFHDELNAWLEGLPEPLIITEQTPALPHILMLHMAWGWVVLLLYQPFSLSARLLHTLPISVTFCQTAALKILAHSTTYRDTHGLRYMSPAAPQILFTAGRTFLFSAGQAVASSQAVAFFQKAQTCIEHLEELGTTWPSGRQKAGILRGMMREDTKDAPPLAGAPLGAVEPAQPLALPSFNFDLDQTLVPFLTDGDLQVIDSVTYDQWAQGLAVASAEPLGPPSQPDIMLYLHAGVPDLYP